MKIYEWHEGLSLEESKNGAYWERNILALFMASQINAMCRADNLPESCGWYYDTDNNWDGWHKVLSLYKGKVTFHIPDDFDIGYLQKIKPNWNGHTTKEKWEHVMNMCGCKIE